MERQITRPLEEAVAAIPGVERLASESRADVSLLTLQFKMTVPHAEAMQQVRDKVAQAQLALPPGARLPLVAPYDIAAQPVLVFAAASGADAAGLRDLLNQEVKPRLEQLEGVAAARLVGEVETEVLVNLQPERLAAARLSPEMVLQRLRAENVDAPAGRYMAGNNEVGVRLQGAFADVAALRQLILGMAPTGQPLRLGDVAEVHLGDAARRTLVRMDGQDAVAVEVIKQAGSNTLTVSQAARAELARLSETLGPRFRADILIDPAATIAANAHEVWQAIYFGGAMAVLIIFLFLLDWRGTLIAALALPTSVVGTLFIMWALGFSLNQLTLLALSLAIGLLIDDAVVVRESITRRLEAGDDPVTAARLGTQEIALAVLATTLTLCAVFVPVAFMEGLVGQFFRQFGLTIAAAVLLSLLVAFTLDPMLSARLARRPATRRAAPVRLLQRGFAALDASYGRSLGWVLAHPKTVVLAALLLLAGSLGLANRLGTVFLDPEDRSQLLVELRFPSGTRLAVTAARSGVAELAVRQVPGVRNVYATIGPQGQVERATWRVGLVDKAARPDRSLAALKADLRTVLAAVPGAEAVVTDPPLLDGLGDWPPLWILVVGPDLKVLAREADFVREALQALPGAADVRLQDSPGRSELQLTLQRPEAAAHGLPAAALAMQLHLAMQGELAGQLRIDNQDRPIRVRLAQSATASAEALSGLEIWPILGMPTPPGTQAPTPLGQLTTATLGDAPANIVHENRQRQMGVVAQLAPGGNLGQVAQALRARLEAHPLPVGYRYLYLGQQQQLADMHQSMGLAVALGVLFIFMVLAAQFESFLHPWSIMLSLPLALVGAIWALAATGASLSLGACIGLILLMGLVTKNAILLVDGALQQRKAGLGPAAAMAAAGPRRLRPILMTSAAMALGMLPTALGRGLGSEFRAPMALAVIGGVLTSTLLTLWVVPVVFVWLERLRLWAGAGDLPARPSDGPPLKAL